MSRIGKKPVVLPSGVSHRSTADAIVIKGPKGELATPIPAGVTVKASGSTLQVERGGDEKAERALHGMVRSRLNNAVLGVTSGWRKDLEIVGIGYKAALDGRAVAFNLGYSHVKNFPIPEGIQIAIEKQTKLTVTGIDRQQVGQVAAQIRALRPPEPYKGKGIKYADEVIKKKVGKTGA